MAEPPSRDPAGEYLILLRRASADPEVVGVVAFGSRATEAYVTPASDVDCFVVLADDAKDPDRWHTPHGAPVEAWALTLDAFRQHGLAGSTTAWNRPAFLRARVDLDRLDGEIARIVERKRRLDASETEAAIRLSIDDFVNSTYRALGNLEAGRDLEGRLDAVESIGPLLAAAFALEGRVRPFNKWLRYELGTEPLRNPRLRGLVDDAARILDAPTPATLRAAFRRLEGIARSTGHGDVIEGWEPDVPWLRRAGPYRAGASPRPSRKA